MPDGSISARISGFSTSVGVRNASFDQQRHRFLLLLTGHRLIDISCLSGEPPRAVHAADHIRHMTEFAIALSDQLQIQFPEQTIVLTGLRRCRQEEIGDAIDVHQPVTRCRNRIRSEVLGLCTRIDAIGITKPQIRLGLLSRGDLVQRLMLVVGRLRADERTIPPFRGEQIVRADLRDQESHRRRAGRYN